MNNKRIRFMFHGSQDINQFLAHKIIHGFALDVVDNDRPILDVQIPSGRPAQWSLVTAITYIKVPWRIVGPDCRGWHPQLYPVPMLENPRQELQDPIWICHMCGRTDSIKDSPYGTFGSLLLWPKYTVGIDYGNLEGWATATHQYDLDRFHAPMSVVRDLELNHDEARHITLDEARYGTGPAEALMYAHGLLQENNMVTPNPSVATLTATNAELEKKVYEQSATIDNLKKDHQEFLLSVDRAFRFLAGLNLRDHPISDQKEAAEIVRQIHRWLRGNRRDGYPNGVGATNGTLP